MNILVTGAYGFVGLNLAKAFNDKFKMYALDIKYKESEYYDYYYAWNELYVLPWENIDIVIHLAGKAHDIKNKGNEKDYFEINTELTKRIFDCFLQSTAKQFFFFSSVKAISDTCEFDFLTEDVTPKPYGPYGESKLKAEEYILSKQWDEKSVYIFRPCMIHGPGNKGNLNLLYNVVSKGLPYPLGAYENKRSFLSIWNLLFIIEKFINKNPESGVYNLADDEAISTNELIKLIAMSKNKKERIWRINHSLINIVAKMGTICRLPFNQERLIKLTENYMVSNEKIKRTLEIDQLPYTVKEGLLQTLKYFKGY